MAKPLHEFGGWLFFFYVTLIIGMVVGCIAIFVIVFLLNKYSDVFTNRQVIETCINMLELIIDIVILYLIFHIIKNEDPEVPKKVIKYLLILIGVTVIFIPVSLFLAKWANEGGQLQREDIFSLKHAIRSIITSVIWIIYFKRSKRVELYYSGQQPHHY